MPEPRRDWIAGGNNHAGTLGVRACRRCSASTGRVPTVECYDFELLHSLCVEAGQSIPAHTNAPRRRRRAAAIAVPAGRDGEPLYPIFRTVETVTRL